jgi:protein tyrosine phosphatase (PTP) superfamily phosphohydrolase (DUF442 family)
LNDGELAHSFLRFRLSSIYLCLSTIRLTGAFHRLVRGRSKAKGGVSVLVSGDNAGAISTEVSMKNRILFHRTWSVALAAALICSTALATTAFSDHKRNGYAVDIENFGKVNDHFYRGAQPKGRHYEQLAALGVKTIVDLREDSDYEERASAERAGLRYINLPMKERSYPQPNTATRFLETVNNEVNWPVYVHCAGGRHRTGAMTAVYRMLVDGWNIDQAYKEMKQFGFYTRWGHGCYKDYVYDYYHDLQARAQVQWREPAPSRR